MLDTTKLIVDELDKIGEGLMEMQAKNPANTDTSSLEDKINELTVQFTDLRYDVVMVKELLIHIGTALENSGSIDEKEAPDGLSTIDKSAELDRTYGPNDPK
jgi:hydrogenase maturation factor